MSHKKRRKEDEPALKKIKTGKEEFDEEVDKVSFDSDSDSDQDERKPTKATKKSQAKASTSNGKSSKASTSKASTSKGKSTKASTSKASTSKASTSKASTSKASTSKGKRKKEESDDDDDEDDEDVPTDSRGKKQKQPALPPSLNPKFANAPKASKPNFKKFAPPPDPSSEVQTATHKHKVVYTDQDGNEQTYFVTKLPHKNFQAQWDGICEMRAEGGCASDAAVDTMGCSKLHDEEADEATQRFQSLVALVLSSMTRDEQTAKAMGKLKSFGLTIDSMCNADIDVVDEQIKNLMNHQIKAYQIIHIARRCRDEFEGDVPQTKAEMMTLPGAGLKICNLAMYSCWGKIEGVGVDTHLNRILQRLRWCGEDKREKQMAELESWLPKAMWWDLNEKLLGFGQKICASNKPKCDQCTISGTCAWYAKNI